MRTLHSVTIENFLSFRKAVVSLQGLNVLVGPNGAGKTNFLRAFQFVGEVARSDLVPAIDTLGGFEQIRFRGTDNPERTVRLEFSGLITEHSSANALDEYKLTFWERRFRSTRQDIPLRRIISRNETIILKRTKGRGRRITLKGGKAVIADSQAASRSTADRQLSVQSESSGLSTIRKLGDEYGASQVDALASVFEDLRLYEVDVERARRPATLNEQSRLAQDASNLSAYLFWLSNNFPDIFKRLSLDIAYILPGFEGIEFRHIGGANEAIVVRIKERHLEGTTPLGRASFGTVRAIALFAMLHDPEPPRLTCLEEVDHGLHPHALDRLVERLREASERTQIIVATHSPALVNRLREDELTVFERDPDSGTTRIVNLDPNDIQKMREVSGYSLGELWFSGSLGGAL